MPMLRLENKPDQIEIADESILNICERCKTSLWYSGDGNYRIDTEINEVSMRFKRLHFKLVGFSPNTDFWMYETRFDSDEEAVIFFNDIMGETSISQNGDWIIYHGEKPKSIPLVYHDPPIDEDLKLNPNLVRSAKIHCGFWKKGICSPFNDRCLLRRDLPCTHFRDEVFADFNPDNPDAKNPQRFPKVKLEYELLYNVKLNKIRNCNCGEPLHKGKTFCSKCREKKKLLKYKKYNKGRH